jgi:microcystin-dependent protein
MINFPTATAVGQKFTAPDGMTYVWHGDRWATIPFVDNGVPAGQLAAFARNTAPTGWLKANGALVSRTTYAALFAAIGTTFGAGDGSTTFALPDARGEFLRGWDDGRGIDASRAFGSAQLDALQEHVHTTTLLLNSITPSGSGSYALVGNGLWKTGGVDTSTARRDAAETRSRNVAALICIKY